MHSNPLPCRRHSAELKSKVLAIPSTRSTTLVSGMVCRRCSVGAVRWRSGHRWSRRCARSTRCCLASSCWTAARRWRGESCWTAARRCRGEWRWRAQRPDGSNRCEKATWHQPCPAAQMESDALATRSRSASAAAAQVGLKHETPRRDATIHLAMPTLDFMQLRSNGRSEAARSAASTSARGRGCVRTLSKPIDGTQPFGDANGDADAVQ